jgi:hypothetical protein
MKNVIVFDNNGETFDRFTILDKKTGDIIGSSSNPFSPQGFGQHCGNVADNYWNVAYGYSWRKRINVKKSIKFAVEHFLAYYANIGKIIPFNTLPIDVQKFAKQSFE